MSKERPKRTGSGWKFMQTLSPNIYGKLAVLAKRRSITVQEYIRVIIIPEHLGLDGRVVIQSEKAVAK